MIAERAVVSLVCSGYLVLLASSCSATDAGNAAPGHEPSSRGGASSGGSAASTPGSGGAGALGGAGGTTAGSAGALGAGGSGGSGVSDGGPNVTFDWPETPPGTVAECKAGRYTGNFTCTYKDPQGTSLVPVNGPISLSLVKSQDGEFLEVKDGVLDGTANAVFTFRADIKGKLDCRTGKFSGTLENGTYSGFLIINGSFQGPLESLYDSVTFAFVNGTWNLIVAGAGGGCVGNWSATYAGP